MYNVCKCRLFGLKIRPGSHHSDSSMQPQVLVSSHEMATETKPHSSEICRLALMKIAVVDAGM